LSASYRRDRFGFDGTAARRAHSASTNRSTAASTSAGFIPLLNVIEQAVDVDALERRPVHNRLVDAHCHERDRYGREVCKVMRGSAE
jgi:hypothetical protein